MTSSITAYLAKNFPFGYRLSLLTACDCTDARLWRCETVFLSQYISLPNPYEIYTYQAPEDYALKDFISEEDFLTSCVESIAAKVENYLYEQKVEGYSHFLHVGSPLTFVPASDSKHAVMRLILFGPDKYEPLLRQFINESNIQKVKDEWTAFLDYRGKIQLIRR